MVMKNISFKVVERRMIYLGIAALLVVLSLSMVIFKGFNLGPHIRHCPFIVFWHDIAPLNCVLHLYHRHVDLPGHQFRQQGVTKSSKAIGFL